jgi:hypothetical protein
MERVTAAIMNAVNDVNISLRVIIVTPFPDDGRPLMSPAFIHELFVRDARAPPV